MIIGTNYFVDLLAARRYYDEYGYDSLNKAVEHKLVNDEIRLGKPPVKEGERLVIIDDGTRYAIVSKEKSSV